MVLRLLATSDLHGRVLSYDYANRQSHAGVGLEAVARKVAQLRQRGTASLLVDAGDFLFGSAMGDVELDADWNDTNPVIAAMNDIGYDAVALGNHDLDYGLTPLARALSQATFPVLCSNLPQLTDPRDGAVLAASRNDVLLTRELIDAAGQAHRVRIGLVSFLPPHQLDQCRAKYPKIAALPLQDPTVAADLRVGALRKAGADVIVALCHDGMETGDPRRSGGPLDLARRGDIDAIVMGHQHALFPAGHPSCGPSSDAEIQRDRGRLAGVPAVMPGCWGRYVGAIDLFLEQTPERGWRVADSEVSLHQTAPEKETRHVGFPGIVGRAHRFAQRRDVQVLGYLDRAATSYFARLGRCPGTMLLASVLRDTVRAEMDDTEGLPVVGLAAPFQSGGAGGPGNYTDIPAGPLRLEHLSSIHPFPDKVCAVEVTGEELRHWFERAAAGFHRIAPGSEGPLVDDRLPGTDFHFGPDLQVVLDLSAPALYAPDGGDFRPGAGRVLSLHHDGREVAANARFLIAVSEYRANGGGGFPGCVPDRLRWRSEGSVRDAIAARAGAVISPALRRGALRLRMPPGANPTFFTGAGARKHRDALRGAGLFPSHNHPTAEEDWLACRFIDTAEPLDVANTDAYVTRREVGAGRHLANPVRSGRKQP